MTFAITDTIKLSFFCLLVLVLISCGRPGNIDGEIKSLDLIRNSKTNVDAFLYDTRIWQNNKPTSVRLELYRTDSMISFNGRAYLGKGALRGMLWDDSLSIYFPKTNELLSGQLDEILTDTICQSILDEIAIFDLFYNLPDTTRLRKTLDFTILKQKKKEIEYSIIDTDCNWQIYIEYKYENKQWLLKDFEFDNNRDIKVIAKRREYRLNRSIKNRKLFPTFPVTANKINR